MKVKIGRGQQYRLGLGFRICGRVRATRTRFMGVAQAITLIHYRERKLSELRVFLDFIGKALQSIYICMSLRILNMYIHDNFCTKK